MKKKLISGQMIILIICWVIAIPCFFSGMKKMNYTEKDVDDQWAMSTKEALEEAKETGETLLMIGGGAFVFGGMQFVFFHTLAKEKEKKAKEQNGVSNMDSIGKLKELLDNGALTEEEFEKKKKELLEKIK